ncbi:MAG: right-handed parallel beta-helix repeat-containing protein, partial [Segetibacter sp.]
LNLEGDAVAGKPVTDIQFRNIIFQYGNVQLLPGNTNNAQGSSSIAAVINLKGAQRCIFDHCTVTNTGGFAFNLQEGSSYNIFSHNHITNIAAGGYRINGGKAGDHPLAQTHHNTISDNEIGNYGTVFPSAVAVLLMHSRNNDIVHNHIHHGYYTGVSAGWEWGHQKSISRDNIIAYNYIHHIGQGLLSDMGAVYTLGVSPGTKILNNLIHDVDSHNYGGWGIYNDEGSTHILVENNIVYNTKFAGYNIHYAKEITVRNNIFALGRLQQINRTRVEPHQSLYFVNNIVY